jgi:hypothetical protein
VVKRQRKKSSEFFDPSRPDKFHYDERRRNPGFSSKIFSTAFGCPRRGALQEFSRILLEPVIAHAMPDSPRRINGLFF